MVDNPFREAIFSNVLSITWSNFLLYWRWLDYWSATNLTEFNLDVWPLWVSSALACLPAPWRQWPAVGLEFEEDAVDILGFGARLQWGYSFCQVWVKGCTLPGSSAGFGSLLRVTLQNSQIGVLFLILLILAYSLCIFLTKFFIKILSNYIQVRLMICHSRLYVFHPLMPVLFFSVCQSAVLGNINVSSNIIHTVKKLGCLCLITKWPLATRLWEWLTSSVKDLVCHSYRAVSICGFYCYMLSILSIPSPSLAYFHYFKLFFPFFSLADVKQQSLKFVWRAWFLSGAINNGTKPH